MASESNKDPKIGILTEVYRPLLVKVLDTPDIIEHLKGQFDKDDAMFNELIEQCQQHDYSRTIVTERLLDILDQKSDQLGLFKAFMDALDKQPEGYKTLKGDIEGTCTFDTKPRDQHRYLLRIYAEQLEKISPRCLLPFVKAHLTDRDCEIIEKKIEIKGDLCGATELLLRLDRKDDKWFDRLVQGLRDSEGSKRLAKELEEVKDFILGSKTEDMKCMDIAAPSRTTYDGEHVDYEVSVGNCTDVVELKLRPYQQKVAEEAMKGLNSVVILPTGTGKTEVAIAVIKERYLPCRRGASSGPNPKTVFVVNKVPLVKQQKERCLKYLVNNCQVAGVSGEQATESPLASIIDINDVTVLTAQILVNNLKDPDSGLKLSDIAFLILDECHHCQKSNPYNVLMAMYRDSKLNSRNDPLPQILGLTASPGVGSSKNKVQAEDHIIKLCANLDSSIAPGSFVSKTKDQGSQQEFQIIVQGRSLEDPYFREISALMEEIEKMITDSEEGRRLTSKNDEFSKLGSRRGQQAYEQGVVTLKKTIKEQVEHEDDLRELLTCVSFLREYNNSLYVNRDAQTQDAIRYMQDYMEEPEQLRSMGRTDVRLGKQFKDLLPRLNTIAGLQSSANPVLNEMRKYVMQEYTKNPDSLSILFTRTRESAKALVRWLNEDRELQPLGLNADFLIGGGSQGMTSTAQSNLVTMFDEKKHKIIVTTSVAEEGLDIQACNLVFRYNYVTSDIGHVQTKGRSRKFDGKVYVIVNASLQLQDRELRNIIKVKMMEETVTSLITMDQHHFTQRILVEQKEDQKERRIEKQTRDALKRSRVDMDDVMFHCTKCFEPVCSITDIRSINDQHHVVCNDMFLDKIDLKPLSKVLVIDGYTKREQIFCNKCQKKWGTMAVYKGTELPLIAVKNFILKNAKGKKFTPKKWKDMPFQVTSITIEDLLKKMNISSEEMSDEEEDNDDVLIDFSNIMQPED